MFTQKNEFQILQPIITSLVCLIVDQIFREQYIFTIDQNNLSINLKPRIMNFDTVLKVECVKNEFLISYVLLQSRGLH